MNKEHIFHFLSTQDVPKLLDLLSLAYDELDTYQRRVIFGKFLPKIPPAPVHGKALLAEIREFSRKSHSGYYYAPFDINSKNFMNVPEETEEWFEELGGFLKASMQLTSQGEHSDAVMCFRELFALIDKVEDGDEIVFGDEIGSWMIPGDEKAYHTAYFTSLASISTPEEFTEAAIPLVKRDSWQSLAAQAYDSAIRVSTDKQRNLLKAEVKRLKIRVER
jgi:hypothetical protein